jgi:hypothetical protein
MSEIKHEPPKEYKATAKNAKNAKKRKEDRRLRIALDPSDRLARFRIPVPTFNLPPSILSSLLGVLGGCISSREKP